MMNTLTMNSVLTDTKTKFVAIILAIMAMVGVVSPQVAYAGGVADLDFNFSESGGVNISGGGFGENNSTEAVWQQILTEFHVQISALFGVFMLVALFRFGFLLTKLIGASDNPNARADIIKGMVVAGVATAALGAATIFFGFFYHMLL